MPRGRVPVSPIRENESQTDRKRRRDRERRRSKRKYVNVQELETERIRHDILERNGLSCTSSKSGKFIACTILL